MYPVLPIYIDNISSVSRPAYMSLPSPNMPTAEDEDDTDGNTEVSHYVLSIKPIFGALF